MKEHKTLQNQFSWLPQDKRASRFGGAKPPRKSETRRPALWLARKKNELYLVNSSEDILDFVIADGSGFHTEGDNVSTVANKEKYEYKNVEPDTAVKIDEYDDFYDCDYILQVTARVQSKNLGCIEITSASKKGGVGEAVLLWNTDEKGKSVSVNRRN